MLNEINKIVGAIPSSKIVLEGTLTRSVGLTLEGRGFKAPIGTLCEIVSDSKKKYKAIVTGFNEDIFYLMPLGLINGLEIGSKIISSGDEIKIPVSNELLGRVIDSNGKPLDNKCKLNTSEYRALYSKPINPMDREKISKVIDVGVKAVNTFTTIGEGQRIGLFAGSGIGKSVLLGMITKNATADVTVICLTGERGREVKDFITENIDAETMKKTVVVAAPADYSAIQRLNATYASMSIAEYFRDQGKKVLLVVDSLTRFSQAQREIALSMGEPPATRGYPPSVFTLLPRFVERAGLMASGQTGSITGIFTVLAEADDENDPIVDAARAILDGHIMLSRELSDMGHYPAISIEKSISRVMNSIVSPKHTKLAQEVKKLMSLYNQNRDLINIGAYVPGANIDLDRAVNKIKLINGFLQQDVSASFNYAQCLEQIEKIINSNE